MSIYLTLSMVPNTGIKASLPRDETHPQYMSATCFLSWQQIKYGTCFLSLFPHIWILQAFFITTIVSYEENNFFQSSFVQFLFSWQKSIRVFLLADLIKLFFLNTLFSEPISSPVISNSNLRKFLGSVMAKLWANVLFLFDFARRNRRFVSSIVRRGFLLLNLMFHTKPVFWNFLMIDWTMVWLIDKSLTLFRWLFPAWLSFIIEHLVWKGISGDLRPHKLNDLLYKRQKVNTGMTYTCFKCRDLSFTQYI